MATFYLDSVNSDLSVTPNRWCKKLRVAPSQEGSLYTALASDYADVGYAFSDPSVPNNPAWEAGDITVNVKITTAAPDMYLAVQVNRISSSGAVLQSSSKTAEQLLSTVTTYTFNIPSVAWTTGSTSDRLRIDYFFRNASKRSMESVYLATGVSEIILPIKMNTSIAANTVITNSKLLWQPVFSGAGGANSISDTSPGAWVSKIDATHFLITYEKNAYDGIYARIGTINGTTITYGQEFTHNLSVNAFLSSNAQIDYTNNKYIVVYGATNTGGTGTQTGGYACIATVDVEAGTVTFGTAYAFDTTSAIRSVKAYAFTPERVVIAYMDCTAWQYKVLIATISGDVISFGTSASWSAIASSRGGYLSMAGYTNSYGDFLLLNYDESVDGKLTGIVAKVEGSSFVFQAPYTYGTNDWQQGTNLNYYYHRQNDTLPIIIDHAMASRVDQAQWQNNVGPWVGAESSSSNSDDGHFAVAHAGYSRGVPLYFGASVWDYVDSPGRIGSTQLSGMYTINNEFDWLYRGATLYVEKSGSVSFAALKEEEFIDWRIIHYQYPAPLADKTTTPLRRRYFLMFYNSYEGSYIPGAPYKIKAQIWEETYSVYAEWHPYNFITGVEEHWSYNWGWDQQLVEDYFTVNDINVNSEADVQSCGIDNETAVVTYRNSSGYITCQVVKIRYAGLAATIGGPSGGWGGNPIFYVKSGGTWHAGTAKVKSGSSWVNPVSVFAKRP